MAVQHAPPPGKYKLTVEDFLRLDKTGVFGTTRTELLDGDVIIMNAEYRPHARITDELRYHLRRVLEQIGSDLYPLSASVALSDHSMPLPDIVLTREPRGNGPIPLASIALIVEVSASTVRRDMLDKAGIYAGAHVPEYWVVEVEKRLIRRLWAPNGARYAERDDVPFGQPISAATVAELRLPTDNL